MTGKGTHRARALAGTLADGTPWTRRLPATTKRVRIDVASLARVDLTAVGALAGLEELYLRSAELTALDLAPLAGTPLRSVTLVLPPGISRLALEPLGSCAALQELRIAGGPAGLDLAPLAGLGALATLLLWNSSLRALDVAPLATCSALAVVWVMNTAVEHLDLAPLAAHDGLVSVQGQRSALRTVTLGRAAGFARLAYLNLSETPLSHADLTALAGARRLREVTLPSALRTSPGLCLPPEVAHAIRWYP